MIYGNPLKTQFKNWNLQGATKRNLYRKIKRRNRPSISLWKSQLGMWT